MTVMIMANGYPWLIVIRLHRISRNLGYQILPKHFYNIYSSFLSFSSPFPFLLLQSLTPSSTSPHVTPSLTSHITTPKLSTFPFLLSSSKNSISPYGIPVSLCMREKCVVLEPGKICRWSKSSIAFRVLASGAAGVGTIEEEEDEADCVADDTEEGMEGVLGMRSKLSISLARPGAPVLDAAPMLMPWCFSYIPISLLSLHCDERRLCLPWPKYPALPRKMRNSRDTGPVQLYRWLRL